MELIKTGLEGLILIKPNVFKDDRGFFFESYSQRSFVNNGVANVFVQDNHSMSVRKGVLRGLHFQKPPHAQAKLVRVTRGSVFDVAVDLRKSSPTFGKWQGFELSVDNFNMLFIPQGFAHGYCTLEENTEFLYKCDTFYMPDYEECLLWNDPTLNIAWPVKIPVLSVKDSKGKLFRDYNSPF